MLINGQKINAPYRREIVFPRVEGDIVFTAEATSIREEFEKKVPVVEPKSTKNAKGEVIKVHFDDKEYIEASNDRANKSIDLQVIRSLVGVQWETVDFNEPDSWKNWRKEASEAGLSDIEVLNLMTAVMQTLQPSADSIKQQRESFLAGKGQNETEKEKNPSQSTEPLDI